MNAKECDAKHRNQIVDGISTLLALRDELPAVKDLPENAIQPRDGINLGTEIILTQLPKVINFLVANIPTDVKRAKELPLVYLNILNK